MWSQVMRWRGSNVAWSADGRTGAVCRRSREGAGVSHEAVLCLVVAVVVQAAVVVVVVIVLERWLIDGSHLASARRGCDYGGVRRDMAL